MTEKIKRDEKKIIVENDITQEKLEMQPNIIPARQETGKKETKITDCTLQTLHCLDLEKDDDV